MHSSHCNKGEHLFKDEKSGSRDKVKSGIIVGIVKEQAIQDLEYDEGSKDEFPLSN